MLTTVDENKDLEAYIYVPTERAAQVRPGLEVDLLDTTGKMLEKTKIDFISPQVDNTSAGNSGKGSGALLAGVAAQRATGEGQDRLEHGAHGGGSGAGSYAAGRTELCVRRQAAKRPLRGQPDAGHPGRYRWATPIPSLQD